MRQIHEGGSFAEVDFTAMGSGSLAALSVLEVPQLHSERARKPDPRVQSGHLHFVKCLKPPHYGLCTLCNVCGWKPYRMVGRIVAVDGTAKALSGGDHQPAIVP